MSYIVDQEHFHNYLNKALRMNPEGVDQDHLMPLAFYIAHIYNKGLADQYCWALKQEGVHLLEEQHTLNWLSGNNIESRLAQIRFKHELTRDFVDTAQDLLGIPGVYSFWNVDGACLYVGRGISLGDRILTSFTRFNSYDRNIYLRFVKCSTMSDAALLEIYFITSIHPALNTATKYNDEPTVTVSPIPEWSNAILCSNVEAEELIQ